MAGISATIRINDAFSAPLSRLSSGLAKAQSGFDKVKNALGGATGDMSNLQTSSNGFLKNFIGGQVIGNAITKGIGLISQNLDGAIDRVDTLNNAKRSFQNMGFSASKTATAINALDRAVTGLPTPIDEALRNTQMLAASTGDIGKSTKVFKAMNDGILGFGGSAADVSNAVVQMSQAFSNGKVDGQTWISMMNSGLGPVLNSIAKKMKMTTGELKEGLSSGRVSVEEFQDALIELDKKGGGGMQSLEKIAKNSTRGLRTSLTNLNTGIKNALGKGIIEPLTSAGLTDFINNFTTKVKNIGPKIGIAVSSGIQKAQAMLSNLKFNFMEGFGKSFDSSAVTRMFSAISKAVSHVKSALSGMGGSIAKSLGSLSGKGLTGVANAITNIANAISKLKPDQIQAIASALTKVVGAVVTLKAASGVFNTLASSLNPLKSVIGTFASIGSKSIGGISSIVEKVGLLKGAMDSLKEIRQIPNLLSGASFGGAIDGIISKIASIGPMLTAAFSPVTLIIAAIGAVIAGAVAAWTTNFLNFRTVVSGIFSNLGNIFAPFINSIKMLGQALQPVMPLIQGLGQAFMLISVGTLMGIALAIGVVVDALTAIISIAAGVVNAVKAIAHGFGALGNALKGDFNGAKQSIQEAKNAVDDMKNSFGNIGNAIGNGATSNLVQQFSKLGSSAKSAANEVNSTKFEPQVNIAKANEQINSIGKGANSKVKIEPQMDFMSLNQKMNSIKSSNIKVKATPQVDWSKASGQAATKTIKTKVVPQMDTGAINAKLASISNRTIKAPKVGTPKVPTPTMPTGLKQIPAPKVGTPKVPMPTMPVLPAIKAPRVNPPSMGGVVAAVSNGMARAAAAARAGGAAISSAVVGAINQAAAAGRAAAGQMQAVGAAIGAGLAAGIQSQVGAVAAAADALIAQANRAARAKAQVHSPSRLFAEIGSFIGLGLAKGISSKTSQVARASSELINGASVQGPTVGFSGTGYNASYGQGFGTTTTNNYQSSSPNRVININSGAITINSSGSTKVDVDALLSELERKILNAGDKNLY